MLLFIFLLMSLRPVVQLCQRHWIEMLLISEQVVISQVLLHYFTRTRVPLYQSSRSQMVDAIAFDSNYLWEREN